MDECCPPKSKPVAAGPAAVRPLADDCCSAKEHELSALRGEMKRVLVIVLAINATMFLAEFTAGMVARSTALMADSVDMLGDALVYALSLYALNKSDRWRAGAAVAKGAIIAVFGVWVFAEVIQKLAYGVVPAAGIMLAFGGIALLANLICLALLYRYRRQDVNMSSTFECSRNDVIANIGVLAAAAAVHLSASPWPDIVIGGVIAVLFMRSAIRVLRQAWPQFRTGVLT